MISRRVQFSRWWRRVGMGPRLIMFILGTVLLASLVYLQRPQEDSPYMGTNLLVFTLVNINVIVLCVLVFLVGRNVVKLIFDRRRKILGSHLRSRLVLAFVGLTLVPTIILFVLASGLLNQAFESWFSSQVESSIHGAVKVARKHYASLKRDAQRVSEGIASELSQKPLITNDEATLTDYLDRRRAATGVFLMRVVDSQQQVIAESSHAAAGIAGFTAPPMNASVLASSTKQNKTTVLFEHEGASQYVSAYTPLTMMSRDAMLVVVFRVDPELSMSLSELQDSFREYEQAKLFRTPLKSGYLLTLAMITGLIMFAAVWVGFYIAREISVPVQRLAEATEEVAKGNYDIHLKATGSDELAVLMRSFNRMIGDLKQSRNEVERRQGYIETMLETLAVGVIGIDTRHRVTSVNSIASQLFGFTEMSAMLGADLFELLEQSGMGKVVSLLEVQDGTPSYQGARQREILVSQRGQERRYVCTAGRIVDRDQNLLGTVVLFDDITDLTKAQQMSVWREVARRIAHEIKNPLTPIQLSAQRLDRLLGGGKNPRVTESTQLIVEHVRLIKRLADEFSNFARMPTLQASMTDVNALVTSFVDQCAENNQDITFGLQTDPALPSVVLDSDQIRRVLINLVDNALAAIRMAAEQGEQPGGEITLTTAYDRLKKRARIEVADNGTGIPDPEKNRIFEPYFTRKKSGTGLGLAIVNSIIADHHGEIRVYDNKPRGTRFLIEIPLMPVKESSRKLGSSA